MPHPAISRALVALSLIGGPALALIGGPAQAQNALARNAPPTATGARPGNDIGTGESLPRSNNASNTPGATVHSTIAPNLPSPPIGPNAGPRAYLRAAQASLATGKTGEAQQSLEMAETRALDRSVPLGGTNTASANPMVAKVDAALRALGAGDKAGAMAAIDAALAGREE